MISLGLFYEFVSNVINLTNVYCLT